MTTRYEAFLPEVLPYATECPEVVAINAIRNACIEFCDKSLYLIYEHDPVTTVANVSDYGLSLPANTTSARVLDAWYNNYLLGAKSEEDLKKLYPYDWHAMQGNPRWYTGRDPDTVVLVPYPLVGLTNGLNLMVALRPTRNSVDIDDLIYQRWAEQIGFGARSRLLDTPSQAYSDHMAASKYRSMFETAIGTAKMERMRGLGRSSLRVIPPRLV